MAGPTASRQANATFSSVSGALRMTSATTAGMTWLALITISIVRQNRKVCRYT